MHTVLVVNLKEKDHVENLGIDRGYILTHCNTQPAVRRAKPSMPLLLILAFYQ